MSRYSCTYPMRSFAIYFVIAFAILIAVPARGQSLSGADLALAPGDTVKLDILDDDKEPVDLLVASDGTIQAPYIGAVQVAGFTVAEALNELSSVYVKQQIFVVPKLGFSVLTYRPIFVIGDVQQPGSYPFQPQLTVEKAIGLAGGHIATDPVEDPVLARARLRGEVETAEANIAREALAFARLTAELAGRTDILADDVPATARDFVTGPLADSLREVELRIAKANTDGFAAQQAVLTEQITEAERQLALLNQLLENVNGTIDLVRSDLKRAETLHDQGLNTQTAVSTIQRQLSDAQARQLEVLSNLSQARRDIGMLKSRLVELSQRRHVDALVELQTHNVSLATHLAAHRKAEEQLVLMSSLTAEKLAENKQIALDFTIRRGIGASRVDMPATAASALAPGDVLVVKISDSDDQAAMANLPAAQP